MGKWKWRYIIILMMTLMISSMMEVAYSYMYKSVFHAVEYQNYEQFIIAMIMCVVFVICRYFQPYMRYFEIKQVRMIVFDIKIAMFNKLTALNMQYFEEHHSGDVLTRLSVDANSLKETYFSRVYQLFVLVFRGGAAIFAMLVYSPKLAMISLFFSLISVMVSISINKIIKHMSIEIAENISRLTQRLVDVISGFLVIKMYQGTKLVTAAYEDENKNVKKSMEKRTGVMSFLEMVSFLIGMLGNFGTIIAGIYLVTKGKMDYGTVMGVVTLQMSVSNMFQNLGGALANFTASVAQAQRVFDFLELDELEEPEIALNINFKSEALKNKIEVTKEDLKLGIDIKNIKFAYKNKPPILNEFNLHIEYGQRIMITGESGCGKSSLLKILLRFQEEQEGEIKIFGHNIKEYSIKQLRDLITYVPQESYLFEGTIKENILYGGGYINHHADVKTNREKSEDAIEASNQYAKEFFVRKAAKMAYADEFIKDLPEGYDTLLTAGGKNLSGGQRQRIAIARAFLKDAPILLLDEPSSALDVESERKINLAMNELMADKIVIMVTHRTNSFDQFDKQIHMKKILEAVQEGKV